MATDGYGPLVGQIGRNLRRLRGDLKLSELSERMSALGQPLGITGLSKIENGKRGVDLDEIAALARALDVPPLLLVFPVGHEPVTEVLSGANVDTWRAARWFTGEHPLPLGAPGSEWTERQRWEDSPVALFRHHDGLSQRWIQANASMDRATTSDARALAEELRASVADQLRQHRAFMRRLAVEPPSLPAPLRFLEEDGRGER